MEALAMYVVALGTCQNQIGQRLPRGGEGEADEHEGDTGQEPSPNSSPWSFFPPWPPPLTNGAHPRGVIGVGWGVVSCFYSTLSQKAARR